MTTTPNRTAGDHVPGQTTIDQALRAAGAGYGPAIITRGDAAHLHLPDETVDLIATSPPYFGLRSYTDGGAHYDGQVGDEATPIEYLDALIACTREWVRVLKPGGSIFVNLSDTYSSGQRFDRGFTAQDAAWLAGVIDSDGSISVRADSGGRSHVAWTRVGQMRPEVVKRIGELTGTGQVFEDARGVWNWNAAAQQARWVLERIWPWLRIKQRQALAAIDLMSQKATRGARGRWNPLTDEDVRRRETIRQAVLAWNRGEEFPGYEPPAAGTVDLPTDARFIPAKSLMLLPQRYAIRAVDELGLILRAEIVWAKPNGLPESVTDRVRRSHEQVFHLTKSARYFAAVDEIREPHAPDSLRPSKLGATSMRARNASIDGGAKEQGVPNPLGKLPGSVWEIPTAPLMVPDHLGVDHFAAYPPELVRRIVLGWSPREVCTVCGEGRRPVRDGAWQYECPGNVNAERALKRAHALGLTAADIAERYGTKIKSGGNHADGADTVHARALSLATLLGGRLYAEQLLPLVKRAPGGCACACTDTTAPATPGVVLDPFGGTGTTALVASAFGRVGISNDLSADYCRLARWRTADPGERARALDVPKPEKPVEGQLGLFDGLGA
jgi:hypothetical protein